MIIKTITCHNVYNVGAELQAYALTKYLNNLGHDAEIIDYVPEYLKHYKLSGVANSKYDKPFLREMYNLLKFPGRLCAKYSRRKREYDRFVKQYLSLTENHYGSFEELCNNPPVADIFLAGSDQIWNTLFQNGRDPAFYLNFVNGTSIKASYAASFSTEDVVDQFKPQVTKWIKNLDYVSVREKSGVVILNNLGIDNAIAVLDPVFLLNRSEWEKIEKSIDIEQKYILLYDFDRNSIIGEYAQRVAKEQGLKIYSVLSNPYCDKCFDQEGPDTVLFLLHHASYIISNSFHATAFSIIYEKKFVVFDRCEAINTRMHDLLCSVGLEERIWNENIFYDSMIDYEKVKAELFIRIKYSQDYINLVLNAGKNSIRERCDER